MFYPYKLLLLFFLTSNSSFMLRGFENKKISSSKGRLWVERLKSSWDLKDTTAYRKEYKAVLSKKNFTRLISDINQDLTFKKNQLEKKEAQTQIRLEKRDKSKKGFYNKTLTFYGKGLFFYNLGIKTKIKLRSRFYLKVAKKTGNVFWKKNSSDFAFLELKIKNPSASELMGVNKLRLKVALKSLEKLYTYAKNLGDKEKFFSDFKKELLSASAQNITEPMLDTFLAAIRFFSDQDEDFLKPLYAISYRRTAYRINEDDYRLKKPLFRRKSLGKMEYQVTADKHIKIYTPQEELLLATGIKKYILNFLEQDHLSTYPSDAIALEVKVPGQIASTKEAKMSNIHHNIYQKLIKQMTLVGNLYPSFTAGKGKASFAKKIINSRQENAS